MGFILKEGSPRRINLQVKDSESAKPGFIVTRDTTPEFVKHTTEGGNGPHYVLDVPVDQTDPDAAIADDVNIDAFDGGGLYSMWLESGNTLAIDEPLESSGTAGEVQKHTADDVFTSSVGTIYSDAIVGYADEAITDSGVTQRIRVRKLR